MQAHRLDELMRLTAGRQPALQGYNFMLLRSSLACCNDLLVQLLRVRQITACVHQAIQSSRQGREQTLVLRGG